MLFFTVMARKHLDHSEICTILENIPSDFDSDTDESIYDETEIMELDPLHSAEDMAHSNKEDCIIIIGENNKDNDATPNIPDDSVSSELIPDEPVVSSRPGVHPSKEKRRWKKKEEPMMNATFSQQTKHDFTPESPVHAFLYFFDDQLMEKITYETNLKTIQKGKEINYSKEDIYSILGINMIMSYHKLPALRNYWSTSSDLEVSIIKNSMTRDKFRSIMSSLHLNDNHKIDMNNRDKLHKVRPVIDHLNSKFIERSHSEHLSVDESMVKFKGRSTLKQYNPMKPIKRGYKIWCLADNDGYVYKFEVYEGKAVNNDRKEFGLGGTVVINLTEHLANKYHKIFFDNFFSSIPLCEYLRCNGILACGTIRTNRKDLPVLLEDKKMKRGDYDYRSTTSGVTVYKWRDAKPVHFISNYHGVEETTVRRKQKDGTRMVVSCPSVVKDYNKYMIGVDKHDQLRQVYGRDRRSVKWWHRLFFGFVDMSLVNSFVIHKETNSSSMTFFDFKREVAQGLITLGKNDVTTAAKRRRIEYSVPRSVRLVNVGVHHPVFDNSQRLRCEVCSKKGVQSRPATKCSQCNVHLCLNSSKNCFIDFHSN